MSEAHIKIRTESGGDLSLVRPGAEPLPEVTEVTLQAGSGLRPHVEHVRLLASDTSRDVAVRLAHEPSLLRTLGGASKALPLGVELGGRALSLAAVVFSAAELFADSIVPGASVVLPLEITQTRPGDPGEGLYEAIISLVIKQPVA
ncbi:CS1 type fimbrial major subunit [Streptomyces sp. NPDC006512]|uniref:CS1 type fimbrial major subunit n=1 Tax=Streptomyces sp. NPDC006512 TaxID=3154307 RepID=UPI0033AF0794